MNPSTRPEKRDLLRMNKMANEKVKVFDGKEERWIAIAELKNLLRKEKLPVSKSKSTAKKKTVTAGHQEGCTCQLCFAKIMERL